MASVYDEFQQLTPAEKIYIALHPAHAILIRRDRNRAMAETKARFGYQGRNDKSDAFRHCFWSALLARDLGYVNALLFTSAHESRPDNPPEEKEMDLHNNAIGLGVGKWWLLPDSDDVLSEKCYEALLGGRLKHLI